MINFIKTFTILTTMVFLNGYAHCAALTIRNENSSPVTVTIKPEASLIDINLPYKELHVPPKTTERYTISEADLAKHGKVYSRFLVKGRTSTQLITGECRDLSFNQNYDIIFGKEMTGPSCTAKRK